MRSSIRSFLAILGLAVLTLGSARSAGAAPGLATPDQILGYLVAHRDDVSLVSYTVTPAGTPDPADPVLRVNAWRPMPLASTIKIVLLAAYAREVAAGRLAAGQAIVVSARNAERLHEQLVQHGEQLMALREAAEQLGQLAPDHVASTRSALVVVASSTTCSSVPGTPRPGRRSSSP